METALIQIKDEVIRLLRQLDPGTDVFFEEIKSTDQDHGITEQGTYYFVELIPNSDTVDRLFTDVRVLVDVAYHEMNESNTAYLIKAAELDAVFRPVFHFGDRYITIPELSHKVADHVLHNTFHISFRHARPEDTEYDVMGELDVAVRKGE